MGGKSTKYYRDFHCEDIHKTVELIGGKTKDLAKRAEVRKVSEEEKKEEVGGGGELRLGDHKGNYLHQPAKSPIKLESTTQ